MKTAQAKAARVFRRDPVEDTQISCVKIKIAIKKRCVRNGQYLFRTPLLLETGELDKPFSLGRNDIF